MGLFDKLKEKAATLATEATVGLGELSDIAASKGSELAGKARAGYDGIKENAAAAMEELQGKSQNLRQWAEGMPDKLKDYASGFNTEEMWHKIETWGAKCGQDLLIMVLTMYYTIQKFIPDITDKKKQK